MAKSARSKTVRRNKRALRANVFQPVVDERTKRLSAHLQDQVNDLTKSPANRDEKIADKAVEEVTSEAPQGGSMDEDKPKISTSGPRDNNRNRWAKKHLKQGKRQKQNSFAKFMKKK
ncbi:uncharacterized protein SOCG_00058 [Schizosaccharomyces octosporus yFS286]|uniref:Fungal protein n=1 Tax=Schizosaccharomyces octosporus (strain yFS286) TaxID=483514 RepID=S9PWA9_SCHOY|nr:uncharacterized protein SOCG_00058 [Schizosaccharomyces octosporus yFS286]EPX72292.1 fungal protein [Schizosaccharomyces octosporus yFS286]